MKETTCPRSSEGNLQAQTPSSSLLLYSVVWLILLQCWFISQPHSVGGGQALPSSLPLILETLNGGLAVVVGSSVPSSWALTAILSGQCLRATPSSGLSGLMVAGGPEELMVSLQPPGQSRASSSPEMFPVQRHYLSFCEDASSRESTMRGEWNP